MIQMIKLSNVYLTKSKSFDFKGFKGFTLVFLVGGEPMKFSSQKDWSDALDKSGGAPIRGDLECEVSAFQGKPTLKYAAFSPSK